MSDLPAACCALAAVLTDADDPAAVLPPVLPCAPLDLLIALHQEVTRTMLSDLAHACRAALAARLVAAHFPNDPIVQAQAHWSQGSAILYVPNYAQSLAHYDAALHWYDRACQALAPERPTRDVRAVQVVRVFCLFELGRYTEALAAVEVAERWLQEHPNDHARLTLLLNRSFLAGSLGDYGQMVELADATIDLATDLDYPGRVAQGWINRGYACIYLGRYIEAAEALDRGIAAARAADEPLTAARGQYNQARLLRAQGQLFAALTTLGAAKRGMAQAAGEAATVALEESALYEQLRQLPEAQRAARSASEQFVQQAMPTYSASAALQAARIAMQQQQTTIARKLLDLAAEQAVQARLPILDAAIILAEAELATIAPGAPHPRQSRRVRAAARAALAILQTNGLVQDVLAGQLVAAALDAQLGDTTAALAIYRRLAQCDSSQIQLAANAALGTLLPPTEALPHLRRAAALAVEQRRGLPMEELQARYSSETSPYHMRLAAGYLVLGDRPQAIESVWSAKAGPLLDLRVAAGILDNDRRTALETAKATIARWRDEEQRSMREALHAAQQGQHERAAYHTRRAQDAAGEAYTSEQALTATLRTLGDRGGQARVPRLTEVQGALSPGQILLEYAQIGDDLVGCMVRPDAPPDMRRLGDYRALAPLLDRWSLVCRRLIDDPRAAEAQQQIQGVLAPLRQCLLAPWEEVLGKGVHLLIAPCGILHHVPWAALFDGTAYLGDQVTLTLTPCGALWAAPLEAPQTAPGLPRLLGFAGSGERHLPHVATELAAIARHLPDAQVELAATSTDLCPPLPPRLLHIAAHGRTNPAAPLCSTIELADGPFLLLEAHRLNLRGTRLVTLSACETSVRPDYGDMALALAGAFLCAGAAAVLASLWAVSDAATASLMERFYGALAEDVELADALRLAQQQVRDDYPLDWAAFQIWAGAR